MLVAPVKYKTSFFGPECVTPSTCKTCFKSYEEETESKSTEDKEQRYDSRTIRTVDETNYLAMNYGCNGHIPSSVGGHAKPKKRPDSVVVERGYEHSGGTASSEYVRPCPLVQIVIYIVYVAA